MTFWGQGKVYKNEEKVYKIIYTTEKFWCKIDVCTRFSVQK